MTLVSLFNCLIEPSNPQAMGLA